MAVSELEYRRTFLNVPEPPLVVFPRRARSLPPCDKLEFEAAADAVKEHCKWSRYTDIVVDRLNAFIQARLRGDDGADEEEEDDGVPSEDAPPEQEQEKDRKMDVSLFNDIFTGGQPVTVAPVPQRVSQGSVGHPDLCRGACAFLACGSCFNGSSCNYCHFPHDEKRAKLDKRQRSWLKELDDRQLLPMLLEHLEARASDKGFSDQAAAVLALFRRRVAMQRQGPEHHTVLAPKKNAQLGSGVSRMTFFQLLRLAPHDQADPYSHEVAQAVAALRRRASG